MLEQSEHECQCIFDKKDQLIDGHQKQARQARAIVANHLFHRTFYCRQANSRKHLLHDKRAFIEQAVKKLPFGSPYRYRDASEKPKATKSLIFHGKKKITIFSFLVIEKGGTPLFNNQPRSL